MTWTLSAWGAEVALADRCRVGSLDDVIGSEQQRLRDGETDLLGRLEIDEDSNFVGCSTGISPGLAPFRILSTYMAARRFKSGTFTP